MNGADVARALAVAANEIMYAIRLGCLSACAPPCGRCVNGERFFQEAARYGFMARTRQATPRVLAWFSLVQASRSGWVHRVKLLLLLMRLAPQILAAGVYFALVRQHGRQEDKHATPSAKK